MKTFGVQSSRIRFLYEKANQEGKKKENHPQDTEIVQKGFEEKTELSLDEQTLPYGGSP